jgi:hypothetical protein
MATANRPAHASAAAMPARRGDERRLALIGLPGVLAEPVTLLAEILGWTVESVTADGMAWPSAVPLPTPPARLCLAMMAPDRRLPAPPILVWSPDSTLNEHISAHGLSKLDQPVRMSRVEQLLQAA